jgi:hypothetical protein
MFTGTKVINFPLTVGNKITYADSPNTDLNPHKDPEAAKWLNNTRPLGILSTYGVDWSRQTIIRDIWQNFYDGHCQTIEGVRVTVRRPVASEPFSVTIEGGAEYAHHLLIDIGGTSKKNTNESAGHFGEGTKIAALLLLRGRHASRVLYSSANWSLEFTLEPHQASDAKMLCTTLRSCPRQSGNRLDLEVSDPNFVYLLLKGVNNFSHAGNPDMQNPTYSGPVGGFKYVPGHSGKVYVGGQNLSSQEEDESDSPDPTSIPNFVVWLHRKTPDFSVDRDRGTLNRRQIRSRVLKPILLSMNDEDIKNVLLKFENLWPVLLIDPKAEEPSDHDPFLRGAGIIDSTTAFIDALTAETIDRGLTITFPPHCLAITDGVSEDLSVHEQDFLRRRGFRLYSPAMAKLGMLAYNDDFLRANVGHVVQRTQSHNIKLGVLRETIQTISSQWLKSGTFRQLFTVEALGRKELLRNVTLFDPPKDTIFSNRDTIFIGGDIFWNRRSFESLSFEQAVETLTRMLLLYKGSEKSEVTSYAITDFIHMTLESISSSKARNRLNFLKRIWEQA